MPSLHELLDADWARLLRLSGQPARPRRWTNHFSPRFAPVSLIRHAHALHRGGWRRLAKLVQLLNFVIFGLEVPATLEIGPGLVITHSQGTVLGGASIGRDVTIYQQVTLGASTADFAYTPSLRPVVEDGVTLTAGAKVLGAVTLGRGCVVGANAVVLVDVPAGSLAVGVPARIVTRDDGPETA
ncbi:MAG: serine acetyltransferase [Burkholderiales bacterium]|nr:serine acetyltransferase [Burkholderiales bacterium]